MDLDQATVLERVSVGVSAGGLINKEEQLIVTSKILVGDNFGQVTLLDIQRKVVLDRLKLPDFESGRRIITISTCSLEWASTHLTYVAVVARGCTKINILVFKHSDCKLKQLFSFNLSPELANGGEPEQNSDQKYLNFPCDVKLSMDC